MFIWRMWNLHACVLAACLSFTSWRGSFLVIFDSKVPSMFAELKTSPSFLKHFYCFFFLFTFVTIGVLSFTIITVEIMSQRHKLTVFLKIAWFLLHKFSLQIAPFWGLWSFLCNIIDNRPTRTMKKNVFPLRIKHT